MGMLVRFLSEKTPESSKRLIAFLATVVLCSLGGMLGCGVMWQVLRHRAVDGNLVAALGTVTVPLAGLAGAIGRKKDTGGNEEDK